jgi:glycosyltransferase involved in cell wall biosynthesis
MHDRRFPICATSSTPVSLLVIARNEEKNIGDCLRSVQWASEVFVVDSLSEDRTVEIARAAGALTFLHAFQGYAAQRNWALETLPFSNEWVLMLDADERVPTALAAEIAEAVRNDGNGYIGFFVARRLIFLGRWLKHGGLYPTWLLRLFNRHKVRFEERPVNEHAVVHGPTGRLQNSFDHCDNRPLSDWIAKHNVYSKLEAEEYLQETLRIGYTTAIAPRLWGSQAERKRWIKLRVWNRLPLLLRPFLFFFRSYVLKRGFLDGQAGFVYHVLWGFYHQFLISAKIIERSGTREPCLIDELALSLARKEGDNVPHPPVLSVLRHSEDRRTDEHS